MLRSFRIPWAADRWFGEDKLTHFVWCYAGGFTAPHLLPWLLACILLGILAGVVEVVQWVRWDVWQNRLERTPFGTEPTYPPRPAFADQPSYRDLAYNAAGLLLGLASWVVLR